MYLFILPVVVHLWFLLEDFLLRKGVSVLQRHPSLYSFTITRDWCLKLEFSTNDLGSSRVITWMTVLPQTILKFPGHPGTYCMCVPPAHAFFQVIFSRTFVKIKCSWEGYSLKLKGWNKSSFCTMIKILEHFLELELDLSCGELTSWIYVCCIVHDTSTLNKI